MQVSLRARGRGVLLLLQTGLALAEAVHRAHHRPTLLA